MACGTGCACKLLTPVDHSQLETFFRVCNLGGDTLSSNDIRWGYNKSDMLYEY